VLTGHFFRSPAPGPEGEDTFQGFWIFAGLRWIAAAALQLDKRYRRIKGCKSMSVLRSAVEAAEASKKGGAQQVNAA